MSKKILVVESDAPFAGTIARALQSRGVEVAFARDAATAIEVARGERPDGIVLCAELTGGSGFVVCNRLRKDPELREVPLLLTSADASEETFEQHRRLKTRADAYLRKPFPMAELLRELGGLAGVPEATDAAPADAAGSSEPPEADAPAAGGADDDDLLAFDAAFDSIAQMSETPGPVEQPISAEDAEAAAGLFGGISEIEPSSTALSTAATPEASGRRSESPMPSAESRPPNAESPLLNAEAPRLLADAERLRGEVAALRAEAERLREVADKLRAENQSLRAQADAERARTLGAEERLQVENARRERARAAFAAAMSLLEGSERPRG